MRSLKDQENVYKLYCELAGIIYKDFQTLPDYSITSDLVQIGKAVIPRKINTGKCLLMTTPSVSILHSSLKKLESLIMSISMRWTTILVSYCLLSCYVV